MTGVDNLALEITPQVLLKAYACGIFPMAESADDPGLFWVEPEVRGIIPLDEFHISKSLKKTLRQGQFEIRFDHDFDQVIQCCAQTSETRDNTWINGRIRQLYSELFEMGHCHTVETWRDGKLIGGLYGVSLRSVFFGESMFSLETNASKVALVYLVEHLKTNGFTLLDTQFTTEHLKSFGAIDVPRNEYDVILQTALQKEAKF